MLRLVQLPRPRLHQRTRYFPLGVQLEAHVTPPARHVQDTGAFRQGFHSEGFDEPFDEDFRPFRLGLGAPALRVRIAVLRGELPASAFTLGDPRRLRLARRVGVGAQVALVASALVQPVLARLQLAFVVVPGGRSRVCRPRGRRGCRLVVREFAPVVLRPGFVRVVALEHDTRVGLRPSLDNLQALDVLHARLPALARQPPATDPHHVPELERVPLR